MSFFYKVTTLRNDTVVDQRIFQASKHARVFAQTVIVDRAKESTDIMVAMVDCIQVSVGAKSTMAFLMGENPVTKEVNVKTYVNVGPDAVVSFVKTPAIEALEKEIAEIDSQIADAEATDAEASESDAATA